MSAHFERARLLLAQSRYAEAEQEVMQTLATAPEDAAALAVLAVSRSNQNKHDAALDAAHASVAAAPERASSHYVLAFVLHRSDRDPQAKQAIEEALRLDPHDPDVLALAGSIELAQRDWKAALRWAEMALELDAEHVQAANIRSMALVQLGRKEDAMETMAYALQRDPQSAFSHANQGWNCLHRNDPRQAQEHFREALRLQPGMEYARQGMLQALKARNPIYRAMLAYYLWMGRLGRRLQWAMIAGIWFGTQFVRGQTGTAGGIGWVWWTLLGLLYAFIYLSWTSVPMFNLLLRLDRFGRHVLSADDRKGSNWFGVFFLSAIASLAWWWLGDHLLGLIIGCIFIGLSICIAATFNRSGRARLILAIATGALATTAAATTLTLIFAPQGPGSTLALIFVYGFVAFQLLANFVTR